MNRGIIGACAIMFAASANADEKSTCHHQFAYLTTVIPAMVDFVEFTATVPGEICAMALKRQANASSRILWKFENVDAASWQLQGSVVDLPVLPESYATVSLDFTVVPAQNAKAIGEIEVLLASEGEQIGFLASEIDGPVLSTPQRFSATLPHATAGRFTLSLKTRQNFQNPMFKMFDFDQFADPVSAFSAIAGHVPEAALPQLADGSFERLSGEIEDGAGVLAISAEMDGGVPLIPIWRYFVFSEVPESPPPGFETFRLNAVWAAAE